MKRNKESILKITFIAMVLVLVLLVGILIGKSLGRAEGSPATTVPSSQSTSPKTPDFEVVSDKCSPSDDDEDGTIQNVKVDDDGQGLTALVSYDMMSDDLPDSTVFDCVAKQLSIPSAVKSKFVSTLYDTDDAEGSEDIRGIHVSWNSKIISDSSASLHVTTVSFSSNN